jgi:hypothetical protein
METTESKSIISELRRDLAGTTKELNIITKERDQLLEALKAAYSLIPSGSVNGDHNCAVLLRVQSVLAKAEGRK